MDFMGRINRLDEHLSNMIAAGEVVERPSGVVKELVENCIDAQAKRIEIQITQGGIDSILISDDGIGMDAQDASIAFERHATSKIKEENDLWNIHTMGFRGEALPSIAAVSHITLRTNNGSESTEVEISYGKVITVRPTGTPQGTTIEVKNLFQKTPARFKHLKSPQYEFSLISDIVQKFALAHPEISFYLSHDGKQIFQTKGTNNLQEVLMQIYGRDVAKSAIAIDHKDYDYHITGYAVQPNFNRATKYYMVLFINGRMIRNYHLQKAIIDAYSAYMPKDRYPIVVLNMDMDAQLVDVNVHPSKWEIRLSKEKQLEKLLYTALDEALKKELQVVQAEVKKEKEKLEIPSLEFTYERPDPLVKLHNEVNESFVKPEQLPPLDMDALRKEMQEPIPDKVVVQREKQTPTQKEILVEDAGIQYPQLSRPHIEKVEYNEKKVPVSVGENNISQIESAQKGNLKGEEKSQEVKMQENVEQPIEEKPANQALPQMEVIGQFHNSYILAQGEGGLYIIDQHAAQERYHFEVIKQKILAGNNDAQPLLIPISIEATTAAVAQIEAINESFSVLGITLEIFGDTTFVVRQLPTWMQDIEEALFLQDMIDVWMKDQEVSEEKLRHLAIATMACHSSIRFHRSLTLDEMKQVIADLGKCEQPFHCPHGRPTFICMSDKQLIKEFLR